MWMRQAFPRLVHPYGTLQIIARSAGEGLDAIYEEDGSVTSYFDTITDVDADTDRITIVGHPFATGGLAYYDNEGGTDNIGLTTDTNYYTNKVDDDTITLHPTYADAVAGTNTVDLSDGSGGESHSLLRDNITALTYVGQREMTIQINAYANPSNDDADLEALEYLERALLTLSSNQVRDDFRVVHLAALRWGGANMQDVQVGPDWERWATVDVHFGYRSILYDNGTDYGGTVGSVKITLNSEPEITISEND